ncbi:MAG: galactokinase family protein [Ardenticatenaceae bacterium]
MKSLEGVSEGEVRFVVSPYRICPIGAHVDHQGGTVLGKTVNAYTVLAFAPLATAEVRLHSLNYPSVSTFNIHQIGAPDFREWGRYARGAAKVLNQHTPLRVGLVGALTGTLPGSGLSSSASVGLAYLHALASVNGIDLTPADFVELDRQLENNYLGLDNGIQDQTTISYARQGSLVHMDSRTRAVQLVQDAPSFDACRIIIAYSGYSRELTSTGFNVRVQECWQAAKLLAERANLPNANILSDIPAEIYYAHRDSLPTPLRRRAEHYFSEVTRVEQGKNAWREGDMARFGALMTQSCHSSIHNYESGSHALRLLNQIVSTTNGVYGSRFSGGGYGGCVVALADAAHAQQAVTHIQKRYLQALPETAGQAAIYLAQTEGHVRVE